MPQRENFWLEPYLGYSQTSERHWAHFKMNLQFSMNLRILPLTGSQESIKAQC